MSILYAHIVELWNGNTISFNRLLVACVHNKPDDLKNLLKNPDSDPTLKDHIIIKEAVKFNHVDIVKVLLDDGRVDPSVHENFCLNEGPHYDDPLTKDQKKIRKLLINHPKVLATSIKLNQGWHKKADFKMIKKNYPELLI